MTAVCCVSNWFTVNAIIDENDEAPDTSNDSNSSYNNLHKKYIRADSSLCYFAFWIAFATFSVKKDFGTNNLVFNMSLASVLDGLLQISCLAFFTLIHVKPNYKQN